MTEYPGKEVVNKVAKHLVEGQSCKLTEEVQNMRIEQKFRVLDQATKQANSTLKKANFGVSLTSGPDGRENETLSFSHRTVTIACLN
jgi:hypothetical protein